MTLEEYKSSNKKKKKFNKKYITSLVTRMLLTLIFVLTVLIISNVNVNLSKKINQYLFKTTMNFKEINKLYNKFIVKINSSKETALVSKEENNEYEKYKDGVKKIVNKNENVRLLGSGIVVYIGEKEGYNKTIIVQQSNGIDVWYGNIDKVNVKLYDYIEVGSNIGTTKTNELYLVFQKDGKYIDYKTVIK